MGDEGPSAVTVCMIVHHVISVCLAQEGRRAWAPLQTHVTSWDVDVGLYACHRLNSSNISITNITRTALVTVTSAL